MPPKKPPTPPVEDDGGPPPPTWEDNLGLSELQSAPWAPFAYILHSTGDGPAEEGTEPPSLHKYVLDALSSREDLGNLTILDKDALVAETIEAASAKGAEPPKEGSAVAAVVEAGAEGATPEMVAALIQEKWLEHMAADIEAKSASSEPAATDDAEAEAPAEEEAAVAEAPAEDSSSAADRVYLFVGWPNTADEICALSKRGVTIHGSFHLTNTPVPGEDGVMPDAAPPHDLLTAVTEAKKGPITDAADPLVDFVWSEIVVPPQPPPPEEGTPEDTPPEPSPADIASTTLRERLPLLWKQTCQFRDVMSKFKTSSIPSMASDYDMGYYTRMMDTIPVSHITVPLVLDVMFEQVCLNRKGSNATDEATAEYRKEEIANFLDSAEASLTGLQMNNNGAEASTGPPSLTLLRHGDEMGFRSTGGQLQARVEESVQRVRDLLALPGDRFKDVFPLKKKTESERGSERTELYHYTNALAPPIVERALMLNEFEKFAKPDEVSDDIAKEGPFVDRTVMEFFGRDTLAQVVENAQMLEVEEKMTHYADHDVCLYNVVRRVPNERIKEKDINVELPLRPQLSEWIKQTCCDEWVSSVAKLSEASYVEPKDQIVISQSSDEPKMCLQSRLTYPADNSLVQTRGAVGGGDSTVFTETVTCGLRTEEEGAITHSRFYSSFDDGSVCSVRMVGEADAPIMHVQVTGREGVTVIVTSDGKVQQLKHQHRDTHAAGDVKSVPEVQRAVLADGTVVRQVGEGDSAQLECLYADGNTAVRGSDSCWVRTNLGGARLMVDPAGKQYFMPPVSTASSTDFQTQSEIYTRGDGTTVVTHKDGTRIVKHADGTSLTVRDADITAEADGFSTVTAHTDSCGFTVQMPDSTVISKTTDADTGASIMTLKKMSGELCRCELVASSGEQLVSVYPSMQAKTDGTPHSFDLSIGAFSNVDGHGNAFRSGHDDLGAAVDLYHDPSLDVQELEDDRNAVVARRVFVLGAPRSGKTTTCEHLNKRYGHQVVSMAAVLREATETDMPDTGWPEGSLPGEVQTLIEESDDGSPVFSDDLLTRLLQARLAQEDCANGWVLDGYPTTLSQADALRSASIVPQKVIMLSCPDEHCEARADPDQCIAPPAPEPEGDDPPPAPLSPHASAVATFRTVEEALKTKFSGMCTVVDAAPPFAPGRPNQSFDKMLLSAKLCLRPENFGGRVQVKINSAEALPATRAVPKCV